MLEIVAWLLVATSFLLIGFFGRASVGRSKAGMVLGAAISALVLNIVASQIFAAVELGSIRESGMIEEDRMLPDMPNLMAGLVLFGWIFFLGGFFAGKIRKHSCWNGFLNRQP